MSRNSWLDTFEVNSFDELATHVSLFTSIPPRMSSNSALAPAGTERLRSDDVVVNSENTSERSHALLSEEPCNESKICPEGIENGALPMIDGQESDVVDEARINSATSEIENADKSLRLNKTTDLKSKIDSSMVSILQAVWKIVKCGSDEETDDHLMFSLQNAVTSEFSKHNLLLGCRCVILFSKLLCATARALKSIGNTTSLVLKVLKSTYLLLNSACNRTKHSFQVSVAHAARALKIVHNAYIAICELLHKRVIPQSKMLCAMCYYNIAVSYLKISRKWEGQVRIGPHLFSVQFIEEHTANAFAIHDLLDVPRQKVSL